MSIDIGVLIISENTPSGRVRSDADRSDWVWLNPSTGALKRYNPGTEQFDIEIPVKSHEHGITDIVNLPEQLEGKADNDHEHTTHGNIDFTGIVSANGDVGLTGQKVIGGHTFTFKKGLLVGYQAP